MEPIEVRPAGKLISERFEHNRKANWPISTILSGITISVNDTHPQKVDSKDVTFEGILTSISFSQDSNAPSMETMLSGKHIDSNDEHAMNALSITATLSGISTSERL